MNGRFSEICTLILKNTNSLWFLVVILIFYLGEVSLGAVNLGEAAWSSMNAMIS
jgi:hypothetical protein